MDALDIFLLAVIVALGVSGYRRGLSWVAISITALIIGLLSAGAVAPPLARHISQRRDVQPAAATGIFLTIVLVIQGAATALGYRLRVKTIRSRFADLDSGLGSTVAVLGALIGTWYLGLVFSHSPWSDLDSQIGDSFIIRRLDGVAPEPPGFLAQLEHVLRDSTFPIPFASLGPSGLPPVSIPATIDTVGTRAAARVTSKVTSTGCGGIEAGSSWPMDRDHLVTNAHVVAGADRTQVETPDGAVHTATVVFFNPNSDVAVLHVPGLNITPLAMDGGEPSRGTNGAVIGYPGGGGERVVPAAVRGAEQARGYNIYGTDLVTRGVAVLATHVIPGNSGGPLVSPAGHVMGLVFAASTLDPSEGYALTVPQISSDLDAARGRTRAVSTQECAP
ncbi:MAG: MarP family serine protease [Candidatus Dormibacteria bacterium]